MYFYQQIQICNSNLLIILNCVKQQSYIMPAEELYEINQRISQIKRQLLKRQQKFVQWSVPYQRILEEKDDKTFYMGRSSTTKQLLCRIRNSEPQKEPQILKSMVMHSRRKIKNHYNELKQLDQLLKRKNKARVRTNSAGSPIGNKENRTPIININTKQSIKKERNAMEDKTNCSDHGSSPNFMVRTAKDRVNPFINLKPDKFIEFYQQNKKQEAGSFKFPGVGLQNTQYFTTLKKQQKLQKNKLKNEDQKKSNNFSSTNFKFKKSNIVKKFHNAFMEHPKTIGNISNSNIFEDRMKKILRYHGDFWTKDCKFIRQFNQHI